MKKSKIKEAVSQEERKRYVNFAKGLKQYLMKNDLKGFKISVSVSKSKRPNPYIAVDMFNWKENPMPNDLRLKAYKAITGKSTSEKNIVYGNITQNRIALNYGTWKEIFKDKIKESQTMKKSEVRQMIKEMINEDKNLGHYSEDHGVTYVDSNFINKSSGMLSNSKLKHMGFGEFYIDTPNGEIQFARQNKKIDGFVGRAHKIYDDKKGKLVKQLIAIMLKNKRIEQVS